MVKILTLDHQYNVESLSALSSKYKDLVFYKQDKNISLYDNYDIINPDIILANEYLYKTQDLQNISCKIINYNICDFIVNSFMSIKINKNKIPILIIDNKNYIDKKTIVRQHKYVKIFGIIKFLEPVHYQYVGHIDSSKSLHNLINDHETVFYTNKNICGICSYLKSDYSKFKTKNKPSPQSNQNIKPVTNTHIYEKYISNIL